MTTSVILQFKMNAMMKDATTKPTFCMRIVVLSTTMVRSKVASLSRREANIELVLFMSSNQPISFLRMAAITRLTLVSCLMNWHLKLKYYIE